MGFFLFFLKIPVWLVCYAQGFHDLQKIPVVKFDPSNMWTGLNVDHVLCRNFLTVGKSVREAYWKIAAKGMYSII